MLRSYHLAVLTALVVGTAPTAAAFPPEEAAPLIVTKPDEPVTLRTFQQPNEVQWYRVTLKKGQDYAIWGKILTDINYFPTVTVYGRGGKQLVSFSLGLFEFDTGSELRAQSAGTHYLKVQNGGPDAPVTYLVDVELDCRQGPTTKCALAVGKKPDGFFNFTDDIDWRRISAKAGQRYTVSMMADISGRLVVRNRRGKIITSCSTDCQAKFKAAYTGPYYVAAEPEDEDSFDYKLVLTSP